MIFMLIALSAPALQSAAPVQTCELRTQAWCILRSGVVINLETLEDKRVWRLHGSYLDQADIVITEDRACSAASSDSQSRSETTKLVGGKEKLVVTWRLQKSGQCKLVIEIPAASGKPDPAAYDFISRELVSCESAGCTGPSLREARLEPVKQ